MWHNFSLFAVLLVEILLLNSFLSLNLYFWASLLEFISKTKVLNSKKVSSKNMENKIQELTDKIYREGVEKGNEEAQRLIANAQEEAKNDH